MALRSAVAAVKGDIQDVLQSGNFYVTEEIARELSQINNALEHIALDNTFLSTSEDWQKKPGNFTTRQAAEQMSGALSAVNQVGNSLYEYKSKLANRNVLGKQENELREMHQWAITSLKCCQQDMEPFTANASDRIKQFGDAMGVTDRYTGYRANLTRGTRDPFKMETKWVDPSGELGLMNSLTRSNTSYRTIDSVYPKAGGATARGAAGGNIMDEVRAINSLNASAACDRQDRLASQRPTSSAPYERMCVQEQAGINTTFPGRTEYMQRFKAPATDEPTCDFRINPSPNFAIYGRPMQTAGYVPSFTEYQTRYDWPEAEKIEKTPWLRN